MDERRNPLEKERFLEGIRQKWCLVFLLSGFITLLADMFFSIDPSPYMNFLLALGTTFIIGASASDIYKIQTVRNIKEIEEVEGTKRMSIKAEPKPSQDVLNKQRQLLNEDPELP